jgi:hypothetical protein
MWPTGSGSKLRSQRHSAQVINQLSVVLKGVRHTECKTFWSKNKEGFVSILCEVRRYDLLNSLHFIISPTSPCAEEEYQTMQAVSVLPVSRAWAHFILFLWKERIIRLPRSPCCVCVYSPLPVPTFEQFDLFYPMPLKDTRKSYFVICCNQ